jgi:hypothetical protein
VTQINHSKGDMMSSQTMASFWLLLIASVFGDVGDQPANAADFAPIVILILQLE